jgi:hypothetical protein
MIIFKEHTWEMRAVPFFTVAKHAIIAALPDLQLLTYSLNAVCKVCSHAQ